MKALMSKEKRDRVLSEKGRRILCSQMYNDYKCAQNTRCCDYLLDNTKCPAFRDYHFAIEDDKS
jgi:hypothetical protein